MLLIKEEEVRCLLPMTEAMRLVRDSFEGLATGRAINQPRRRLVVPSGAALHQMAGVWGNYFGTKIYSTHVKHGAHFHVMLYDAATAEPLALFEANWLGQIRTGAATGVATQLLAREDSRVLGIIGTGFQARSQVEAVRQARKIDTVRVWSRNPRKRSEFASETGAQATETAEQAIREADVIVTATFAKDPVLEPAWVRDGAHVNAVGSNNPERRELPADLVMRAGLIAADSIEQARIESGDLILAFQPADWESGRVVEMSKVVSGAAGRSSPDQITIFKSNGLGVQDVAAAAFVYERVKASRA